MPGGAVAENAPRISAGELIGIAQGILRSYAALAEDDDFDSLLRTDALMDAMSVAYREAIEAHEDDEGNLLPTWSGYTLAAYAAFHLMHSGPQLFADGELPPSHPFGNGSGIAGLSNPGYLQGCALLVSQGVIKKAERIDMSRGLKSEYAKPLVDDAIRTLNLVAKAPDLTAKSIVSKLDPCFRAIAAKKQPWNVRTLIQRRWKSAVAVAVALLVGMGTATGFSYAAWHADPVAPPAPPMPPPPPPVVGTLPAASVRPAIAANVTEKLEVTAVGDASVALVEIDPWAAPPSTPSVLILDDPLRSQLNISVKLRLQVPVSQGGANPSLLLSAGWGAGTMVVSGRTTLTNANHRLEPEGIHDLEKPGDQISIGLDGDTTETIIKMMIAVDTPGSFLCGYNPAPASILLTTPGEKRPVLVTAIPIYVVKNC